MRVYILRRTQEEALRTLARIRAAGEDRVLACAAAPAHIEILRQSGADAFVLDAVLPGPDGPALARALAPRPCVLLLPAAALPPPDNACFAAEVEVNAALDALRRTPLSGEERLALRRELLHLGFKPNNMGTRQLGRALELTLRDEGALSDLAARVYAPIARETGRSAASVERNIRYAIECAWVRGDLRALQARFGYTVEAERGKPTNRAFLAQLSEYLRLRRISPP